MMADANDSDEVRDSLSQADSDEDAVEELFDR
jgi:hypothetical protein